jgi:hypothetical protein
MLRLLIFLVFLGLISGCTEDQRKDLKHTKSGLIGLKRSITLYDCSGKPIRSWQGRFKVELNGGVAAFIDDDGNEVKVAGTFIIEEID